MFNLWSETNANAKKTLKPDLGLRVWNDLSREEKLLMWRHLDIYFFDRENILHTSDDYEHRYTNNNGDYYAVYNPDSEPKRLRIDLSIGALTQDYKVKNYAKNYLKDYSHFSACTDFYLIFIIEEGDAVLELLSFYCKALLLERDGQFYRERGPEESEKDYQAKMQKWEYENFDEFAKNLNDVFGDFGLNIYLTRSGFIPKQDDKIVKEIFEPVIQCLANPKWKVVSDLLSDAFSEYRKNTPNGYSTCVTHTVSAIQAFLQIVVNGKTGAGDISQLIVQAQKVNLIPSDMFTKEIFKKIESIIMRERQETGDPHPKKEYATGRNAKLVLNLAMIFLQHSMVD